MASYRRYSRFPVILVLLTLLSLVLLWILAQDSRAAPHAHPRAVAAPPSTSSPGTHVTRTPTVSPARLETPAGRPTMSPPVPSATSNALQSVGTIYLPAVRQSFFLAPPQPASGCELAPVCTDGTCKFANLGMHLGNRPNHDWNEAPGVSPPPDFLARLRGNAGDGVWPAVVVAITDQVFNIPRYAPQERDRTCGIKPDGVNPKQPHLFSYLREASQAGVKILLRIAPSPGNFKDAINPTNFAHELLTTAGDTPEDHTYCAEQGRDSQWGYQSFRAVDDLMAEMHAIMTFLSSSAADGFNTDNVYFIPANEPNHEWYSDWESRTGDTDLRANSQRADAWDVMNAYFSNLYDAKTRDDIRLLTPPMSQWNFAEEYTNDCAVQQLLHNANAEGEDERLVPVQDNGYTRLMSGNGVFSATRNDGYAWNNYWQVGQEPWFGGAGCIGIPSDNPPHNHHVFQTFPEALRIVIRSNEKIDHTFIVEADLLSPAHPWANPPATKDDNSDKTVQSLRCFANAELGGEQGYGAKYMALWLLTQQLAENTLDPPANGTCQDLLIANGEVAWHMAYLPNGTACDWFTKLWSRAPTLGGLANQTAAQPAPTATATIGSSLSSTPTPDTTMQVLQLRTPIPNAPVYQGPATEISPTQTVAPRYRFRAEKQEYWHLFVQDTQTNQEQRLGTDQGDAFAWYLNDNYAVWSFQCYQCDVQPAILTGFYAYDLQQSRPITIVQQPLSMLYPELDGDWLIYVQNNTTITGTLWAYHLTRGDRLVLEDALYIREPGRYSPAITRSDLYAIHGTTVVWSQGGIQLYDLETHTRQTLPLPDAIGVPEIPYPRMGSPLMFSLSERVIVWHSAYSWWGYDRELNYLFPLSLSHPDIATKRGGILDKPAVVQDSLFWSFLVEEDDQVHFFTAPILRDE